MRDCFLNAWMVAVEGSTDDPNIVEDLERPNAPPVKEDGLDAGGAGDDASIVEDGAHQVSNASSCFQGDGPQVGPNAIPGRHPSGLSGADRCLMVEKREEVSLTCPHICTLAAMLTFPIIFPLPHCNDAVSSRKRDPTFKSSAPAMQMMRFVMFEFETEQNATLLYLHRRGGRCCL